nr:MAG TPA: hypothetical protein [Caudoviricetes sp.]
MGGDFAEVFFAHSLDAVPGLCFVWNVGGVCVGVFVLCGGELVCDLYELCGEFCECCVAGSWVVYDGGDFVCECLAYECWVVCVCGVCDWCGAVGFVYGDCGVCVGCHTVYYMLWCVSCLAEFSTGFSTRWRVIHRVFHRFGSFPHDGSHIVIWVTEVIHRVFHKQGGMGRPSGCSRPDGGRGVALIT